MTEQSDPIRDYIRAHRDRYTREAITARLVAAGHERQAVDASWDRLVAEETMTPRHGANMALYAWIIYGLGAAAIVVFTVILGLASNGAVLFGVGWLVAYVVLAVWPIWWLSGRQPESASGVVMVVLAAPIIVLLIGGGICAATIAVITNSFGP